MTMLKRYERPPICYRVIDAKTGAVIKIIDTPDEARNDEVIEPIFDAPHIAIPGAD